MPDWLVKTTIGRRSWLVQKRASSKIPGTNSNWSGRWIKPRSTLITPSRSRKSALLCIVCPIYMIDGCSALDFSAMARLSTARLQLCSGTGLSQRCSTGLKENENQREQSCELVHFTLRGGWYALCE